jgi:hypothetical protein
VHNKILGYQNADFFSDFLPSPMIYDRAVGYHYMQPRLSVAEA